MVNDIFTQGEIDNTLKIVKSTIHNCEKIQLKLKKGSPSFSLLENRLKALHISEDLLNNRNADYSKDELEKAVIQISSIKNKSITGFKNAKEGSSTYTRFLKLINAMDKNMYKNILKF